MTTTVRRPAAVEQEGQGGDAGGGAGGAAAPPSVSGDPTSFATIGLTLVTVVVALSLGRLFADGSFVPAVVATAVGCHGVSWAGRRWGLSTPLTLLAGLAVPLLVVAWIVLPGTTFFGVPTGATLSAARNDLSAAYTAFRHVVAPAPVTDGFVIAAVIGVAASALLADAAAFVVRATFEAAIPSFTLFVFTATLGTGRYRSVSVGAYLGALLLFLMLHQESLDSQSASWFASRARGGRAGLLRAGAVLGTVAVLAAVFAGPHLPGAGAKAVIRWRGDEGAGSGTRTTVSPLVNIRTRLVDRANVEVFTVRSTARAYWRLTSLDRFDGEIWSSEGSYQKLGNGLRNDDPAPSGDTVVQDYDITQLSSIWLPGAYEPRRVTGLSNLSYNPDSGSVISKEQASDGLAYQVQSVIPHFTAAQLAAAPTGGLGREATTRYLAQPTVSARVRALAQQVAGRGSQFDRAKALQDFFRSGRFTYDLRVPAGHDGRALERFLFDVKRGYCEQFAGSYAVLARLVGLPARVAVGFTAGELGRDGLFHVRDLNAHAWPEVYLSGFGWVAFEPTPGRGAPGAQDYTGVPESQASVTNPATATTLGTTPTTEAPQDQQQEPTTVPSGQAPTSVPVPTPSSKGVNKALLAALAVLLLGAAYSAAVPLAKRLRRSRRRAGAVDPALRVLVAWAEATEALDATRVGLRPAETMAEYADRAARQVPLPEIPAGALLTLAGDASAASYSAVLPEAERVDRAQAAAAEVESAVRETVSARRRFLWAIDPRPLFSRRRA
jgi:transglutaminase-like putative cysteine protease